MDYATFKALLFFGSATAFCFWQLAVLRRLKRERSARQNLPPREHP